jgi:flagella basal body P-ring formation protein FlgA
LSLPLLAWGEGVTIMAKSRAAVRGLHITIGDVAAVDGDSPATVARVRDIVLGQAPAIGEERSLPGEAIRTRLKQHGFQAEEFTLQAPSRIMVTRASQRLTAQTLELAVTRAIKAQMPWHLHQTTIRDIRGIDTISLPPGAVDYDVVFAQNSDFLGPTPFTILVRVAGHTEERLSGTAYIEVAQEVVTTTRQIARYEVLDANDLRLVRVQMEQRPRQVLTSLEEAVGKRARRPLRAHAPISPLEIEDAPVVHKGAAVLLLLDSPGLKVTAVGVALEPGRRSDTIRVKNTTSEREVRAIVIDAKTVRVPF